MGFYFVKQSLKFIWSFQFKISIPSCYSFPLFGYGEEKSENPLIKLHISPRTKQVNLEAI